MMKKEMYQAPALEELDSSLACLLVRGQDDSEGSGIGEPEPDPEDGF